MSVGTRVLQEFYRGRTTPRPSLDALLTSYAGLVKWAVPITTGVRALKDNPNPKPEMLIPKTAKAKTPSLETPDTSECNISHFLKSLTPVQHYKDKPKPQTLHTVVINLELLNLQAKNHSNSRHRNLWTLKKLLESLLPKLHISEPLTYTLVHWNLNLESKP